ncbi:hypothetical protein PG984_011986 [Apiospora sp. TS-2023a]
MEQKSSKEDGCFDTTAKKQRADDLGDATEENAPPLGPHSLQVRISPISAWEVTEPPDLAKHDIEIIGRHAAIVSSPEAFVALGQHWAYQNGGRLPCGTLYIEESDPVSEQRLRQAYGKQHQADLPTDDSSSTPKDLQPAEAKDNSQPDEHYQGDQPSKKRKLTADRPCGWCNKPGHTVLQCAAPPLPPADGFIHACPVHNTRTHTLQKCRLTETWDITLKWNYLVFQRRLLPPLLSDDTWESVDQAYAAVGSPMGAPDKSLPFTAEFAKGIKKEVYDNYDYTMERDGQLGYEEN